MKSKVDLKRIMMQSICISMDNLNKNIQTSKDKDFIIANAQGMSMLAEAYKTLAKK